MNTTCLELAKPTNKHLRLSCNDSSIYHCLLNGNSTNEFEICKNWKWIPGVHLYRQLMNTTCLELAKPSNKHLRLSCNDTSMYHCLLNGNSTNEFEICKKWKWIPEGNCAQVRNTTCLELARPSNQQFRLSCNNIGTYHCLLDQNYTNEFEICKMWKWIPKESGKSVLTATYTLQSLEFKIQLAIKGITLPRLSPVSSNWTSSDGNGGNASSFRTSENAEKHIEIKSVIFFLYIIVIAVVLFISAIFYIQRYMGKGLYMEGQSNPNEKGKGESGRNCNDIKEKESPTDETDLNDDKEKPAGSISGSYHDLQQLDNEEDKEESTDIFDDTFERLQQIPQEIVTLNEDDDEQLSHDSSSAVATTNEAGKTVTE
uniref:Uncharacterized protein n=1 Tax=Magallana gigas TaxID=29159 RepID=K1Q446_MAGGI